MLYKTKSQKHRRQWNKLEFGKQRQIDLKKKPIVLRFKFYKIEVNINVIFPVRISQSCIKCGVKNMKEHYRNLVIISSSSDSCPSLEVKLFLLYNRNDRQTCIYYTDTSTQKLSHCIRLKVFSNNHNMGFHRKHTIK